MKNSKKIMLGSALILALSVNCITNISYADEAIDIEKKSEQVSKENQLDKDRLIDENDKKDNENIKESSEKNEILSNQENDSNIEVDDSRDVKENSNLEKISEKSDESNKQYSRVDENSYKDINEDGNINFNKEEYDKAKEYERSDEYQRSKPYSKVQNIKSIEENKRIEKFDENLNIGFANGTITKNSASVLRDFVKFNYKNDKAYFADRNYRRFNISFDTKDFDPSKAGEYKIKARVLSYTYSHSGFDIKLGRLVENFIRVKVVDDGNDRVFYDTYDNAYKAAEDALKKEKKLNTLNVVKSPENSKYFYNLSYDSSKNSPDYTPSENSKEEIDRWYKDYNETRKFLENAEKNGFQDLNKYDENSQNLIKHFIDSKFSSKYSFLTREEFEKAIPYQLLESNINFYKNFYYSIANKVKLLAQYDFKNKKANRKLKLDDRNFVTIYNADLEKGNKLPIIKDLVDFKDLKDNLHVNYNWDPETIDTNKLGKQTLKVKFTYLVPGVGEKEFTENIIINIVDSKNSPSEKLSKKDIEKELVFEKEIDVNKFTKESYQAYKLALEEAKDLLNNENPSQSDIEKALSKLKYARKNLLPNKNNPTETNPSSQKKYFDTKEEAAENAKKALKNNKEFNNFEIKTTADGKYYFELSKKDDKPVKTIKVQKNNSKNIINKENKPNRQAKSNNVKTGIASLSSVLSLLSTSFLGFILSKKNK